ncbi:MAG: ABC transporter substrate-binding protein [Actinomycetota bacterium]|nr:ABC transporter substrate-binding protein [Actinomycetota bacterium]
MTDTTDEPGPGRPTPDQPSSTQPRTDWRKAPEPPPPPSFLSRFPMAGVALAVVLGLGAVLAFVLALQAGGDEGRPAIRPGGVLRVGAVGLRSLDPLDAREPVDVMVADQVFDTLVTYDPRTLAPRAGLAAAWEANPEQTVFTFRLAETATFHDGTPVTAADVKFTLERIAAKDSDSPLLAQLEAVAGFGAYRDGSAPSLAGVETPADNSVVVRLDRPVATFPAALGHPGFGIVPQAKVTELGAAFKDGPVGSGPFRVTKQSPAGVELARAARAAGQPAANLDGMLLLRFDTADAAYQTFLDGGLDVAPVPPGRAGKELKDRGRLEVRPYLGVVFYAMNLKSPDLADARLRQAVSLAIDRQRIVAEVYKGEVEVATGLVAAGVPGRAADPCGERCAHDPERAKVLLAEAFPGGGIPEVAIDHDDDPTQTAVAASIKADLDQVGIPSAARPHPFAEYPQFLVSGQAELFRLGWVADYPSPDGFLTPLFSSSSPENLTGLASPEVDQALAAARAEPDPAKRQTLYRDVEQQVLDQFVVVPVAQLEVRMAVAKGVQAFALNPLGSFDGATVALAAE